MKIKNDFIVKEKTYYIDSKREENKANTVIFKITLAVMIITIIGSLVI